MLEVRCRGGFSDRNGIKPENTEIQLKDFDERTRISFVNITINTIKRYLVHSYWGSELKDYFCLRLYRDVYHQIVDVNHDFDLNQLLYCIQETIVKDSYDSILTILEPIVGLLNAFLIEKEYDYKKNSIFEQFNEVFEKEYVGYRFINGLIMPISDKIEVSTINDALKNKYEPVRKHLSKACIYLSNREKPDYENSIKESISAVESICRIITEASGNDATLGKMLNKLKSQSVGIHGALADAFKSLYGFASNGNGIRHGSGMGGPSSTFAEAKFMLVACSAFVNYLMDILSNNEINLEL